MSDSGLDELSQLEELLSANFEENNGNPEARGISEIDIFDAPNQSGVSEPNIEENPPTSTVHNGDTDSSDDEEQRNYTERKYNDYGSKVKKALDHSKEEQLHKKIEFETRLRETNRDVKVERTNTFKKIVNTASELKDNAFCAPPAKLNQSDIFTDPVFGIRISKPLISSNALLDRMQGREAVNMLRVKRYVENEDLSKDWVIAGVIVRKNISKSQKGNQFAIWTLSDLMHDLKTVSLFLFRKAYSELWKTSEGTVVAILNPNVLDKSQNTHDVACLSIESPERVMILGQSKDLAICKSRKKNGDPCKAFVNLSQGEHCIYHVKLDYQKYSKRQELQSSTMGKGLVNLQNKVLGKSTVIYGGKAYSALPSGNTKKVKERDQNRLMSLSEYYKSESDNLMRNKAPSGAGPANKKCDILHSPTVPKTTDHERLNKLNSSPSNNNASPYSSLADKVASSSLLGKGFSLKGTGTIDLNVSYSQKAAEKVKANAIRLIEQNGGIQKIDPNNIKGTPAGKKRALEKLQSQAGDENASKKVKIDTPGPKTTKSVLSERFKKIMEATSAHQNLIQQHDDNEQDKYFDKLEKKEAMEERMLNTYKLACKAVRCAKCKYTALSAAQKCKDEKHPLKVLDTFKRFFKCGNCSKRTISLEVIPIHACSNCKASNWQKAPMIRDKKVTSLTQGLSIRGEEETYIGGNINSGKNIDLLVPDS